MGIILAVPDPGDWFKPLSDPAPDYLDTFGILAEAAAELKCAADTIYGAGRVTSETLASARAAAERAIAAIDAHRREG